jgi:uncharacterized protein (DUF697 family)
LVTTKRPPISPGAVLGVLQEIRRTAKGELTRGGVAAAVREGSPEGAAALVYVIAGDVDDDDERVLREAERARIPIVAVITGPGASDPPELPYVPAGNVVAVESGGGFPVERIGRVLGRLLGERATPVAARLPAIRRAVCEELIARAARQNGLIGAAIFLPGADLPVLTLNQVRLVLQIADAHGFEIDRERVPELIGVIGGGMGFRALARQALGAIPIAGWAVKGGIAYAGTRALGEAALRYFEARAPVTKVAGDRARFPR